MQKKTNLKLQLFHKITKLDRLREERKNKIEQNHGQKEEESKDSYKKEVKFRPDKGRVCVQKSKASMV